jgi:hypothetical protein
MGSLFSRTIIVIGFMSLIVNSLKIQKQLNARNQARSLLNRLIGSSSGATNLKLSSGEASAIEDNTNQSSLENSKFVALSGGVNQSGLLLKGNSSGQTATAGNHDVQVEDDIAIAKGSNAAVSIINSLRGNSLSTSLTKGGSQITSDNTAATETRETATISEINGIGNATTTSDSSGSLQIDESQASGDQSGTTETVLEVEEGSGNSEIADEHSMDIESEGLKASTFSSSSGQVQINGSGTAQILSNNSNKIDIFKRLR